MSRGAISIYGSMNSVFFLESFLFIFVPENWEFVKLRKHQAFTANFPLKRMDARKYNFRTSKITN